MASLSLTLKQWPHTYGYFDPRASVPTSKRCGEVAYRIEHAWSLNCCHGVTRLATGTVLVLYG